MHQKIRKSVKIILIISIFSLFTTCATKHEIVLQIKHEGIQIDFDNNLFSRIVTTDDQGTVLGDFTASETITVEGEKIKKFTFTEHIVESFADVIGKGKKHIIIGSNSQLKKEVIITLYNNFPSMALFQVRYTNKWNQGLKINSWTNNHYMIRSDKPAGKKPVFWSYQSGSYESRPDWVLPLNKGFEQENYLGMNATDYGGGTPVSDVWRKDIGLGVGHVEKEPKLVSLPVEMPHKNRAEIAVSFKVNETLSPGMSLNTLQTFVAVHTGDYYNTLTEYRRMMVKKGITFLQPPETAYEPIWCAWGFRRDFTIKQIYNALPKAADIGYEWAVLDDGWQTAEGDWYLVQDKFPRGDADMKALVDKIHSYGMKAKLWWAPLAVDPGTDLIKNHPEYLLLNEDSSKRKISWWNAYYLCPGYSEVQQYTEKLVKKIMDEWGYDGLKIDGQHLNLAPRCYNPAHNHKRAEESVEATPDFFEMIYKTALSINPEAVVEICPCGTAYNFHTMPYMNQPVASDPTSSWQIRLKGKTFKALMGPQTAYYGDHVELSDGGNDFASTVGIGGVVGTKFTWPAGSEENSRCDLTAEREKKWRKWLNLYEDKMLPQGMYLGHLYDIGFDKPEAHAIKKDGIMYYAFYADSYDGEIQLRGLKPGIVYSVNDYVNQKNFGKVKNSSSVIDVSFEQYLLLEAVPQ
ncbi:MAG: alpha-galactosidase [bacterium]